MTFDDFTIVRDERKVGGRIDLDGHWFEGCRFKNCEIVFNGNAPFGYADTYFDDCRFAFEGHARMVLSHFSRLLLNNGQEESAIALLRALAAERRPTAN